MSVSAGSLGSLVQDVEPRAVRAHHLVILNVKEHARMAERSVAAVAGDDAAIDVDRFGRRRRGGTFRHQILHFLW